MHYKKVTRIFIDRLGFTLVELLLLLAVIGILTAITVSVISGSPIKMP